ncbi:MAG TPA: hypothetical protein VMF03_19590 [Steroidobacteraceae bacterium]|nr:hypothetical protein [Steroidobacteraceae bacterium]
MAEPGTAGPVAVPAAGVRVVVAPEAAPAVRAVRAVRAVVALAEVAAASL